MLRILLLLLAAPCLLTASSPTPTTPPGLRVLPSFRNLSQPLIYYSGNPVALSCAARPQTARVRILIRRPADTNFQMLSSQATGAVSHTITNPDNYRNMDIHCQASTASLGKVLSRPVRLVKTMLDTRSARDRFTTTVVFFKGNIAQVLCNVPKSQPKARIEFLKDGDRIGQLDKYKVVRLSNSDKMVMLIKDFSRSDTGLYSCRATNPKTLQQVDVKRRTQLKISAATKQFKARFHVDDPFLASQKKVWLMEGENATLYCLPEGAPIPTVKWYRHTTGKSLPDNAIVDSTFGTLRLVRVNTKDEAVYMCSAEQNGFIITSAIYVTVRRRLKIINAPGNVQVKALGHRAKFSCTVAGGDPAGKVKPEWYHNGRYIDPLNIHSGLMVNTLASGRKEAAGAAADGEQRGPVQHGSLTINSVTTDLLGVYQCVARSNKEWDSASAALALSTDKIITGEEQDRRLAAEAAAAAAKLKREKQNKQKQKRKRMKKKRKRKKKNKKSPLGASGGDTTDDINGGGGRGRGRNPLRPNPYPDRGAGGWKRPRERSRGSGGIDDRRDPFGGANSMLPSGPLPRPGPEKANVKPSLFDRPQAQTLYDNLAVELTWKYKGQAKPLYYRVQYQQRRAPMALTARNSAMGNGLWAGELSHSVTDQIKEERFVMVKSLKAGYIYRFRVSAVMPPGTSVLSEWSNVIDFSHVIPAAPKIYKVIAVGQESLRVLWKYDSPRDSRRLDKFVILVRRLIDSSKNTYGGYTDFQVSRDLREYVITQLLPGSQYQVAIYGKAEKRPSLPRMITQFSNEVSATTEGKPLTAPGDRGVLGGGRGKGGAPGGGPYKRKTTHDSMRLMFYIIGGLAGLMLVVMAFLVGMCLMRQRREKKRSRAAQHAQLNGTTLDSYKDPAKMLHRRQQAQAQAHANSQFLLAQLGGGGPNHTGTWSGPPGPGGHHQSGAYLRGSSASVQQLHQVPGSAMNLNVVPETQSLMMDHYHQQHQQHQHGQDMTTDLGGYGPPPMTYPVHGHHGNGTLGSKSQLSGITSHHHHPDHDMVGDIGYPHNTGSVGPYRPLGSGYAPFMTSGQRPSHLDVRPTPAGDAESIYSYFSQQEMGVQHCSDVPGGPPMPYRPQLAEAGSQTTDRQQHRHHRRRRRKQPPGTVPPTGPGGPLPVAMEHSVAPSPPMMRDMAVNTDLGSTDGTYDQPATGHMPYGYPHAMMGPGGGMGGGHQYQPQPPDSSGGATASSAASSTAAYQSVTPPARMASLGPHHGYHPQPPQQQHPQHHHQQQLQQHPQHYHHQQQQQHPMPPHSQPQQLQHSQQQQAPPQQQQSLHHQQQQQQQQQQVDMGPAGPADASTLTRRGTPTLFVDPPKMRDYSEYAIPETKA